MVELVLVDWVVDVLLEVVVDDVEVEELVDKVIEVEVDWVVEVEEEVVVLDVLVL